MAIADYGLGIESVAMWFNSGGHYKWYNNANLSMSLDSSGRVGIGITPNANIQLYVISDTTNPTTTRYGTYSSVTQRSTATGGYNSAGSTGVVIPIIDSGVSNTGWTMAQYAMNLRNSTLDSGTLAAMHGNYIAYGHSAGGSTKTTTSAYGIFVQPYGTVGTITNLYGVYLSPVTTGGTVTNNYGIYQADPDATN